jgi:hypothetical protein
MIWLFGLWVRLMFFVSIGLSGYSVVVAFVGVPYEVIIVLASGLLLVIGLRREFHWGLWNSTLAFVGGGFLYSLVAFGLPGDSWGVFGGLVAFAWYFVRLRAGVGGNAAYQAGLVSFVGLGLVALVSFSLGLRVLPW